MEKSVIQKNCKKLNIIKKTFLGYSRSVCLFMALCLCECVKDLCLCLWIYIIFPFPGKALLAWFE